MACYLTSFKGNYGMSIYNESVCESFFFFFFAVQVWVCSTEMSDYYDHKVEKKLCLKLTSPVTYSAVLPSHL